MPERRPKKASVAVRLSQAQQRDYLTEASLHALIAP